MCQLLPGNENLKSHLPLDVYNKLEHRMNTIKANLYKWLHYNKPGHTVAYVEHVFKSITGETTCVFCHLSK